LAAYDSTTVDVYCNNNINSYIINAGRFIELTYDNQVFCGVKADMVVLVSQFSHVYDTDLRGDPMMTLVPATSHYTHSIISSTIEISVCYTHYINIIVLPDYYQPELISITTNEGINQSLDSVTWVPIIRSNITEAYAAQVNMPHGVFEVAHVNKSALMTVVVYGFAVWALDFPVGYGHPGWLMDKLNDGMYVCAYIKVCMSLCFIPIFSYCMYISIHKLFYALRIAIL